MGIRTWPGYELFGDDCNACFDPGKTPKKIYASFTGIELCQWAINLGVTKAPNRTFILEQTATPCHWRYFGTHWRVDYEASKAGAPAFSGLTITSLDVWPAQMFHDTKLKCVTAFENDFLPGGCLAMTVGGFSGEAQCFWRPAESSPSIRGIMEKLNIEPEKQTFAEVFPVDDDNLVLRLARQKDATNIKIKFEHTL